MKLIAACARGSQMYRIGEQAAFEVSVSSDVPLPPDLAVTVHLTSDTQAILLEKTAPAAAARPLRIEGALPEPGFLRCRATMQAGSETLTHECAAAFEPERILPVLPEPEDFDAFWQGALARLDSVPDDVQCEPAPEFSTAEYNAFRVSFAAIEESRVFGVLTVPTAKYGAPPFPAVFEVPSAGPSIREPKEFAFTVTPRNYICFNVNVHAYDIGMNKEECSAAYRKLTGDRHYFLQGIESPGTYYFHRAAVGIHRAMKWLYEREDVDRAHFLYYGGSQGGFMGFNQVALAGGRFTAAMFHIPAMADVGGSLIGRHPPPLHLPEMDRHLRTLSYYDAANFARRIQCPVMVTVGFIDNSCYPSSVYAAYNVLPCEKYILNCAESGHGGMFSYKKHHAVMWSWMRTRMNRDF